MEAWRGPFPFCPFKIGTMGAEVTFHHRCRSRKNFGVGKTLAEFPQTCPKIFYATFACKFSPTKIMKTSLWCNLEKKVFTFLCKPWAPFFEVKQRCTPFLPGLSGLLPRFAANQNFWECACNPCTLSPIPLFFMTVSQVISSFIKKQIYCSYSGTQKIQNDFL